MRTQRLSNIHMIVLSIILTLFIIQNNVIAQDKVAKIDQLIQSYVDYDQFIGAVLVAEKGKIIHKKGYGMANMEWNIPNAPDTKFRLGSITKQFTSMLIMQLVNEKAMQIENKVTEILPDYREDTGNKITVFHLLTHTSGLPNYTSLPGFMRNQSRDPYSVEDFVKEFCSGDLEFEPGSRYAYSNSGYFLLGALIEKVTGKTYEEVLQERIWVPLDMKNTGYDHHATLLPHRATGHTKIPGGYVNARYLDMSLPYAAGSLYSTVEDLYIWDQALYTTKLLPRKMMDKMFTPYLRGYAFGWGVRQIPMGASGDSVLSIQHSGGINGFNTIIKRFVDDKHLIVVLNNTDGNPIGRMSNGIANILYDQPADPPQKSLSETLFQIIEDEDVTSAVKAYHELKEKSSKEYNFGEGALNRLGYQLLRTGKLDEAIEIFKLYVEVFPESSNAYDSLGEAYMTKGEDELAIKSYARSVELNPGNTNAIDMMKKIITP